MTKHWKRSRITKALTDATRAGSFEEAEARLDAVHVAVVPGPDQGATAAGQAAALSAVATACKCFGRVTLISQAEMMRTMLYEAARSMMPFEGRFAMTAEGPRTP